MKNKNELSNQIGIGILKAFLAMLIVIAALAAIGYVWVFT